MRPVHLLRLHCFEATKQQLQFVRQLVSSASRNQEQEEGQKRRDQRGGCGVNCGETNELNHDSSPCARGGRAFVTRPDLMMRSLVSDTGSPQRTLSDAPSRVGLATARQEAIC